MFYISLGLMAPLRSYTLFTLDPDGTAATALNRLGKVSGAMCPYEFRYKNVACFAPSYLIHDKLQPIHQVPLSVRIDLICFIVQYKVKFSVQLFVLHSLLPTSNITSRSLQPVTLSWI